MFSCEPGQENQLIFQVSSAATDETSFEGFHCAVFNKQNLKWRFAECFDMMDAPTKTRTKHPLLCEEKGHRDYPNEGRHLLYNIL